MTVSRILVSALFSLLTIPDIGGYAQISPSDTSRVKSSGILFSVDVFLDESTSPVALGIRDGQTVAQAALEFCNEQGFDEAVQARLMPQLVKVLEDGMTEENGPNVIEAKDETVSSTLTADYPDPDGGGELLQDSTPDDLILTLKVSSAEGDERTLPVYAGQDPVDVALAFCKENLASPTSSEALTRCSDALSAHIAKKLAAVDSASTSEIRTDTQYQQQQQDGDQRQQDQLQQEQHEKEEIQEEDSAPEPREPVVTVPLNINGLETVLEIFRGSRAVELASDFCRREELGLEESSMDSCQSQITDIAHNAIMAYEAQDGKAQQLQAETNLFSFKVPVTLAGLQLHAEFSTSETPRASALRFCTKNLRKIESALGLELFEGGDQDMDASQDGADTSEGRTSLTEACTVVVEDAINAVLLGLRERVLEAEMMQANVTDPTDKENARRSLEQSVVLGALSESKAISEAVG